MMNGPHRGEKEELRMAMLSRMACVPVDERLSASTKVCSYLLDSPHGKVHDRLLAFASFDSEINLWPLLHAAWSLSSTIILPRVVGQELELYHVPHRDALEPGKWGIMEPAPSLCKTATPDDISVALVPGLAFDAHGFRLGRGKGCYDRLIPLLGAHVLKLGVFFSWQQTALVPTEEHDRPVDLLLTENGFRAIEI